ncbi:MAG: VOC family protein [Ilumatobacter sp.]|nr:VOC family protein [Ilumatobacter sp.]
MSNDPFDALAGGSGDTPTPDPAFVTRLRRQLVDTLELDAPTIDLPERKPTMSNATDRTIATAVVPYLTVDDGAAALDWYATAFGATEVMRVESDGILGHAEFTVGGMSFYLSDEHPQFGVLSPRSLGGTSVAMHVTVDDVDTLFARAVEAGATALAEPADQPHGARHGTLVDPYGHRWLLSQPIEAVDVETYRDRAAGEGYAVTAPPRRPVGQIWAAMPYADAPAGIRFLVDVLGFEEQIVVPNEDDPTVIEHSQLRWPEGGILQASTANRPGNPYSERPTGSESLYVVTADPDAVWRRCQEAGVEVVDPPRIPDYAPDTMVFSIRDPEGNIFSFGSYAGE